MWGNSNPCALLVGIESDAATIRDNITLPQKLKMELPYVLAIPFLSIYLTKMKTFT